MVNVVESFERGRKGVEDWFSVGPKFLDGLSREPVFALYYVCGVHEASVGFVRDDDYRFVTRGFVDEGKDGQSARGYVACELKKVGVYGASNFVRLACGCRGLGGRVGPCWASPAVVCVVEFEPEVVVSVGVVLGTSLHQEVFDTFGGAET